MPANPMLDRMRLHAIREDRDPVVPATPSPAAGGLRVVPDVQGRPPIVPRRHIAVRRVEFGQAHFDKQWRCSARRALQALGWNRPDLEARIDREAGVLWILPVSAAVAPVACQCGCTGQCGPVEAEAGWSPADLPPCPESPSIDAKGQLVITRGLAAAADVAAGATAALVAIPDLDAVALCSPAVLLAGALQDLFRPTNTTTTKELT